MLIVGDFRAEKKANSGKEIFYYFSFPDFNEMGTKRNEMGVQKKSNQLGMITKIQMSETVPFLFLLISCTIHPHCSQTSPLFAQLRFRISKYE